MHTQSSPPTIFSAGLIFAYFTRQNQNDRCPPWTTRVRIYASAFTVPHSPWRFRRSNFYATSTPAITVSYLELGRWFSGALGRQRGQITAGETEFTTALSPESCASPSTWTFHDRMGWTGGLRERSASNSTPSSPRQDLFRAAQAPRLTFAPAVQDAFPATVDALGISDAPCWAKYI